MAADGRRPGTPVFSHRARYVNFAEHLQNAWNPNLYYPGAPNQWADDDWRAFFRMLSASKFNVFEYWLPPTLMNHPAPAGGPVHASVAEHAAAKLSRLLAVDMDTGVTL